jgi:hypothetical protein
LGFNGAVLYPDARRSGATTMKNILILAGIAAVASATPALAKPGHHGNDRNHQRTGWGTHGAWGNSCPPGLAKKRNGCQAPGQARKRYNVGQRWSNNYGQNWSYNQIPYDMRQRYNLSDNNRYYYRDGYLYQVNPRTSVVSQVLSAILR